MFITQLKIQKNKKTICVGNTIQIFAIVMIIRNMFRYASVIAD